MSDIWLGIAFGALILLMCVALVQSIRQALKRHQMRLRRPRYAYWAQRFRKSSDYGKAHAPLHNELVSAPDCDELASLFEELT